MTLYTLYCERCQRRTTHDEFPRATIDEAPEHAVEHPRYDKPVLCRDCKYGRSREDVPDDGLDATAGVKLKVEGVDVRLDPDEMQDDESIYEYVARIVKERHMDDVVTSITDDAVESAFVEHEDGVWPREDL